MRRLLVGSTLVVLAACAAPASDGSGGSAAVAAARDSAAHQARANNVRVINSNNTDSLASMLTADAIFLAANAKPIVDTGWGFVVYHREGDGVWRVARDAFGPDHPPTATK